MSSEPAPRPAARRRRPHPARRARRTAGWLAASAACVLALGMGISTRLGDQAETSTSGSDTSDVVATDQTSTASEPSTDDDSDASSLTDAGSATGSTSTGSSSAQTNSSGSAA